ncbi:MAG TPA: Crp/Fnr family transcriptional regulator [Symbiobacteriaceae bacterium]|jgi:CRP-like cAMP-binding protein
MRMLPNHAHCRALTDLVQGRSEGLARAMPPLPIHAGTLIYAMGEPTDHMYLVTSGRVRTSILSPGGKELVMGVHGPGEVFGELCFCAVRQRQEQALALEDTVVVRLDVDHLTGLMRGSDGEAQELLELFCHRMADMQERMAELAFASVRSRLGLLLLRLAEGGVPAPEGGRFSRDNLTHEEMAARVATTREQVSAILSQFREGRLVQYQRGGPVAVFADRLSAYLESAG